MLHIAKSGCDVSTAFVFIVPDVVRPVCRGDACVDYERNIKPWCQVSPEGGGGYAKSDHNRDDLAIVGAAVIVDIIHVVALFDALENYAVAAVGTEHTAR